MSLAVAMWSYVLQMQDVWSMFLNTLHKNLFKAVQALLIPGRPTSFLWDDD